MNRKYFKIGFIIFFILFVIFVIVRKNIADKEINNPIQKEQTTKIKIEEKKEPIDPRISINLKDDTSNTNLKIEEKNDDSLKNLNIEEKSDTSNIEEEIKEIVVQDSIPKTEIIIEKTTESVIKNEVLSEKETIKKDTTDEIIVTKDSTKNIEKMELEKIDSIHELKEIKENIKIDPNTLNFMYHNKSYKSGDKFGTFEIISIKPKKIRFKKNDYFFYNLRFYI